MKQKIIILMTIHLLFNSVLSAQNFEKMKKSELRDHIIILTTKIDSLKNENINLQESVNNLYTNSSLLEQKNKTNEDEISRLNELILKNKNERNQLISENKIVISKLNEIIISLKDSISSIQSSSNIVSTSTTSNSNDFLNKYYFDQIPLPNNSFSLVLSKLVYWDKSSYNNYRNNDNQGAVERIPEILESNAFTYWGVKPDVKIIDDTNFNDYVFSANSGFFNSKLPKIEILKNKLFTIKYNDGSEESFLFNVNQMESEDNNNQRKILEIGLANEEVKSDGSNNKGKDIVWRFFAIENECYLALTFGQLERLNLNLFSVNKGLRAYSEYYGRNHFEKDFDSYYKSTTTGEGIYLSRKRDLFMDTSKYINPNEIIYLFKLK